MSKERSPRESCSMTTGTRGISLGGRGASGPLIVSRREPVENGPARETPLLADPSARRLARLGHPLDLRRLDLEQGGELVEREYLGRAGRLERVAAHGEGVVRGLHGDSAASGQLLERAEVPGVDVARNQPGHEILLRRAELEGGAVELASLRGGDADVEW